MLTEQQPWKPASVGGAALAIATSQDSLTLSQCPHKVAPATFGPIPKGLTRVAVDTAPKSLWAQPMSADSP